MSYLDTENGTAQNLTHWLLDPLDNDALAVLRRVERGAQGFRRNRLDVAYLIARGCIAADCDAETLTITAKGRDALAFCAPPGGGSKAAS